MVGMSTAVLKDRLQSDLTQAIRTRDEVRSATIRMVLTAVKSEEVAGTSARELSDAEVITVLGREAKKRREAATAFGDAGRVEMAAREVAELAVIEQYLPQQLTAAEVAAIVEAAVAGVRASGGPSGMAAMGPVMKVVQPQVQGLADGAKVAALVRVALTA
jgi:uncharacterized protein